jgi:hypothetical protein
MSEFYLQTRIPYEWQEDSKQIVINEMKRRIPDGAVVRIQGYLTLFDDMYSIIYLLEKP